jgi:protein phosphatase
MSVALSPTLLIGPSSLRLETGAKSDIGRHSERRQNEDWLYYAQQPNDSIETRLRRRRGRLFIVCDGMGGREAGHEASDIAGQTIRRQYYYMQPDNLSLGEMLRNSIQEANREAFRLSSQQNSKWFGMGATAVAAVVQDNNLFVAHVGDSRAYLVPAEGAIKLLTRDHTWVREALDSGRISPEEAETHPNRGALTRSLGNALQVEPDLDVNGHVLSHGDVVVLCSDGLTDLVGDNEIQQVVTSNSPQAAAEKLVRLANDKGGPDNITVLVVRAYDPRQQQKGGVRRNSESILQDKSRLRQLTIGVLSIVVVIMALTVMLWMARACGGTPAAAPSLMTTVAPLASIATPSPRILSPTVTPIPGSPVPTPPGMQRPGVGATNIPSALPVYPVPVLRSPSHNETFTSRQASIYLVWDSVGVLGADDYYVIKIVLAHGEFSPWVKDIQWLVPDYLFDQGPGNREYRWTVTVYHQAGTGSNGEQKGIPVSGQSTERTFVWKDESGKTQPPATTPTKTPTAMAGLTPTETPTTMLALTPTKTVAPTSTPSRTPWWRP